MTKKTPRSNLARDLDILMNLPATRPEGSRTASQAPAKPATPEPSSTGRREN